jgi:site-specific DNA recombinase
MKKLTAYARYSSTNQREESIDAQLRAIQEYADKNGFVVVKTYIDKAKTGTDDDREQFQLMMEELTSGVVVADAVIVHKSDRFARNRYDSVHNKRRLGKKGVRFISVLERFDDSPESIMMESMIDGMNEYYSRNLARETLKGMKENALKAKHTGGSPPLGFDVDEDKYYIINEEEARIIRMIYQDYIRGLSMSKITQKLNLSGLKTKYGNKFSLNAVSDILGNEKYKGTYVFNKVTKKYNHGATYKVNNMRNNNTEVVLRIEGGMPAIVPPETFDIVQNTRLERKINMRENTAKETYLLSGIMYCGKCGEKMIGNRKKPSKTRPYRTVYRCSGRKKYKICDKKEVDKEKLEAAIINYMSEYFFNEKYMDSIVDNVHKGYNARAKQEESDLGLFSSKLEDVKKEEENLLDALAKIGYSEAIHKRLEDAEEKIKTLEELIAETQKVLRLNVTRESIVEFLMSGANIKNMEKEEQKAVMRRFIEKIEVYDDKADVTFLVDYFNEYKTNTHSVKKGCLLTWCG